MTTTDRLQEIAREGANGHDSAWLLAIAMAAHDLCDLADGTRGTPTTVAMRKAWDRLSDALVDR